jgi:uroporphyrin-III C-methyltransferase/precorrin-2 dehydrogenase/sirohydrochlorin ferrochelatase
MRGYPIFLDLNGRRVIVLGEGEAAERRAATFTTLGACVERIATAGDARVTGCAIVVGAGAPEDELRALSEMAKAADLISLRGLRLLGEADVIVHDRLGTAEVLDLARRDAARIDVGKSQGDHTMTQHDINALLVRLAREGQRVVRLKGGDPFIFGRGGEEVEALADAGIAYAVVPGITAALACAASANIPLTHRAAAHAVTFVTAHRRKPDLGIDYAGLLRPGVTLAIYMGLATLPRLRDELAQAGFSTGQPAVLVENGGTLQTRVLRGSVEELANRASAWSSGGPVLILLGGSASRAIPPR